MKTSTIGKVLLLSGTLAVAGGALAYGPGFGGKDCPRTARAPAYTQLEGLSGDQRTQLDALHEANRESMQSLYQAMRDNRDALREAMRGGAPQATVAALAEKQGDLVAQKILQRSEMQQQVDAILSEEQRQALADQRAARRGPGRHW